MKPIKILILIVAVLLGCNVDASASKPADEDRSESSRKPAELPDDYYEKVIVGKDTVSVIMPERNFGRFDRGLYKYLFIPKGQWAFGLTASYGAFSSDDVQILSVLKDFDFTGKIYSVNPSVAYFFRNNQSVGLRFDYSHGMADLGNLVIDIDDDLNIAIKDASYHTESHSVALFYRNYIGLSNLRRFAVFNEVALSVGGGTSEFKRYYDGELRDTRTTITQANLTFSPGLCVFITDYVSFNVSIGVVGLKLKKESQQTNGVDEGSRFSSGANFKLNLFNINFGLGVHI